MMQVIKPGTQYDIDTSNGAYVRITFCHKDEAGQFVHGITNEDLLTVLVDRMLHLVNRNDCQDNIQALLFIKQARQCLVNRNNKKILKRKHDDISANGSEVSANGRQP